MSAPTPNAELAYRVLDHIDAHPDSWDQGVWLKKGECGTLGCFAGWAVTLAKLDVEFRPLYPGDVLAGYSDVVMPTSERLTVREAACRVLGIGSQWFDEGGEDEEDLFDGHNTREDLGRLIAEIFGPRPVDWNKPLLPVIGVPASGCDCAHDGGYGLSPWPDRERGHAEDCPAFGLPPGPALPLGTGCRCDYLGTGTPEHAPSPLCVSLRPDADRDEMQPPPCADHEVSQLWCSVCTAQRRAFYTALGRGETPAGDS